MADVSGDATQFARRGLKPIHAKATANNGAAWKAVWSSSLGSVAPPNRRGHGASESCYAEAVLTDHGRAVTLSHTSMQCAEYAYRI